MVNESYFQEEMTRGGFISHLESFIKQLLSSPRTAKVDEYLLKHGLDNQNAIKLLMAPVYKTTDTAFGEDGEQIKAVPSVLIRSEKIVLGDDGKDKFTVTYKVPRFKFKEKMRNLYRYAVENQIIDPVKKLAEQKVDECDCAGCLQGGGDNFDAGEYSKPISSPIKRKTIYITEDQLEHLEEATTTFNAGDYTYTAPAFGDKETLNHKNIFKNSFQK